MSKTLMIQHVVFCTKHRSKTINLEKRRELYSIMYHLLKKKKCWVYRINGISDHVHLLFDLHPSLAMADVVKMLKVDTNKFMAAHPDFQLFNGWGEGYFAVSVSPSDKDAVIQYIVNQEQHHLKSDFLVEIEGMLQRNEMRWQPDDWD